jgi:hypothetical protein
MATRRRSPRVGQLPTFNVKAVGLDKTKPVVASDIKVSTSAIGSEESKRGLAQTPVATRIAIGGLLGAGVGAGIGAATRKQGKKRSLAVPAAAALSASGVEISVAEALPEGVWQALTDIKAALPSWGGAMSGSVKDAALSLRDDLIHLRDVTKWDFLEEAYSTMIDGDLRMDMVADRLSS